MQKPRPYNGAVPWIRHALSQAEFWSDLVLAKVVAEFPYPPERKVRLEDWVALVSHCSVTRMSSPSKEAHRLAMYVKAYREAHGVSLSPMKAKAAVQRGQKMEEHHGEDAVHGG